MCPTCGTVVPQVPPRGGSEGRGTDVRSRGRSVQGNVWNMEYNMSVLCLPLSVFDLNKKDIHPLYMYVIFKLIE